MKNKKKLKKSIKSILIIIFLLLIGGVSLYLYDSFHGIRSSLSIKLNGPKVIKLEAGEEYKEKGAKAYYRGKNISKKIKITGKVNNKKLGKNYIKYTAKYKHVSKTIKREVKVIDDSKPSIKLKYDEVLLYVGNEYKETGYEATDNYDGDLTDKVEVTNNVDINTEGEYEVIYTVKDSSGNKAEVKKKVKVVPKVDNPRVAVLNYHFFYDPDIGEACNEEICERVSDFKEQLDYLKENNFKTLTMQEFRDFMYGEIEIPEKSVLITIDDGAMGTGKHNGNKLIPILEEYKMHATLFLITGWWDIENYRSEYLDIESHTNDMHKEGLCGGVTRGAQMLCSSNKQVSEDLQKSIEITGSTLAFCFPFYAYNSNALKLVKDAGFDLAFVGGSTKASRKNNKYLIPRYPIVKQATINDFKQYVN